MKTKLNIDTKTSKNPKLGFKIHALVFLLVTPVIFIIWYLTDTTYPCALWSHIFMGNWSSFHYLGVFVFRKNRI